jgi:hypothetical protein
MEELSNEVWPVIAKPNDNCATLLHAFKRTSARDHRKQVILLPDNFMPRMYFSMVRLFRKQCIKEQVSFTSANTPVV